MLLFILIAGCSSEKEEEEQAKKYIATEDGVNLAYQFGKRSDHAILFLHQLGGSKEDYIELYNAFGAANYSVLALDFRGHGESDLDYTQFTDEDWQKLVLDVQAARDFLAEQSIYKVVIIGESIGANAAVKFAAQDGKILSLVLISPGEEYHGIKTLPYAPFIKSPVRIIAGIKDEYSAVSSTKINNALNGEKDIKLLQTDAHGRELLKSNTAKQLVAEWVERYGDAKITRENTPTPTENGN